MYDLVVLMQFLRVNLCHRGTSSEQHVHIERHK